MNYMGNIQGIPPRLFPYANSIMVYNTDKVHCIGMCVFVGMYFVCVNLYVCLNM